MRREDSKWWRAGCTREWWRGVKEPGVAPNEWAKPPLPRAEREAFLASLSNREIEEFFHDWRIWGRDNQLAPEWDWDTWLLLTGRGFGKTRTAVETILDWINNSPIPLRIAIVGQGEDDVRTVMVNGESGFIESAPPWNKPVFRPSVGGGILIWPNGSQAFIYSIADTEALRGPQFHYGWCDEPMAAPRVQRDRALDNLEFCLRLGEHPRLILTTTPKKDPWLRKMEREAKDPENKIAITRGTTHDNADNLAANFLKKIERKYRGTRLAKQEIDGVILADEEGALWTEEKIEAARLTSELAAKIGGGNGCPTDLIELAAWCDKVVVSVDPNTKGAVDTTAARSKKLAHAAGIIVLGSKGRDRFVIADRSTAGGPAKWGKAAVAAAEEFDADEIHAESNQGGEMVRLVVQQEMAVQDYTVPIHLNFANKSKAGRAEPVATVYDRGEVHHAGPPAALESLETQMVYLHEGEDPTGEDFDRVDALVWGLTRLGLKKRASSAGSRGGGGFRTFGDFTHGPSNQRAGGGLASHRGDPEL